MPPAPRSKRAVRVKPKDAPKTFEGLAYPSEFEMNEPPSSFNEYMRCFFGRKGIGKTTLVASFPKSLTLMAEPRRRGLKIRQLNLQKYAAKEIMEGAPDIWEQIKLTTPTWIDDESIEHLNFDSVDIFYESCYHSICASHKINSPADAGKASADIWLEIRDEWAAYFDTLGATRLGINFVSHIKGRDVEELDGSKIEMRSPSCSPACLQYIRQAVDFVFYYGTQDGQHAMWLRDFTSTAFVAVGPEGRFMQPDGKAIEILQMPTLTDKVTGYERLVSGFNNLEWDMNTPEDERGPKKPPPRKGPPKRR